MQFSLTEQDSEDKEIISHRSAMNHQFSHLNSSHCLENLIRIQRIPEVRPET